MQTFPTSFVQKLTPKRIDENSKKASFYYNLLIQCIERKRLSATIMGFETELFVCEFCMKKTKMNKVVLKTDV